MRRPGAVPSSPALSLPHPSERSAKIRMPLRRDRAEGLPDVSRSCALPMRRLMHHPPFSSLSFSPTPACAPDKDAAARSSPPSFYEQRLCAFSFRLRTDSACAPDKDDASPAVRTEPITTPLLRRARKDNASGPSLNANATAPRTRTRPRGHLPLFLRTAPSRFLIPPAPRTRTPRVCLKAASSRRGIRLGNKKPRSFPSGKRAGSCHTVGQRPEQAAIRPSPP